MFLSTNDNIADWFRVFCAAHLMAHNHVCNPARFDDLIRSNDNRKPIRVWVPDTAYQCATTFDGVACSHLATRPYK